MRVVAGTAKGRKLKSPSTPGTRPVMDRVKTALFDILSPRIRDTYFLDLFAGTGSIGIEALSRGAKAATFVEQGPEAYKCIRDNLAITGFTDRSELLRTDAFAFLERAYTTGRRYDILYIAPPQYHGMAARAVIQVDGEPPLRQGGLVIVQIHPRERDDLATLTLLRLRLTDERRYGSTLLVFYEVGDPLPEPEVGDPLPEP